MSERVGSGRSDSNLIASPAMYDTPGGFENSNTWEISIFKVINFNSLM